MTNPVEINWDDMPNADDDGDNTNTEDGNSSTEPNAFESVHQESFDDTILNAVKGSTESNTETDDANEYDTAVETVSLPAPTLNFDPEQGSWTLALYKKECLACEAFTDPAFVVNNADDLPDCHAFFDNVGCPTQHITVQYINVPKTKQQKMVDAACENLQAELDADDLETSPRARIKFVLEWAANWEHRMLTKISKDDPKAQEKIKRIGQMRDAIEAHFLGD